MKEIDNIYNSKYETYEISKNFRKINWIVAVLNSYKFKVHLVFSIFYKYP